MKKSKLIARDINEWMRDHWRIYSSQAYCGKLLRLWISGQGRYRVLYGEETLYEGFQVERAIAAWNAV